MATQAENCDSVGSELTYAAGNMRSAAAKFRKGEETGAADEILMARARLVRALRTLDEIAEVRINPPKPNTGCFMDSLVLPSRLRLARLRVPRPPSPARKTKPHTS